MARKPFEEWCPRGTAWSEFERLVAVEVDDCVLWPWSVAGVTGYGQVRRDGNNHNTHRLACIHHHGPPPFEGAQAIHSCRNRHCMNYRHLRWATQEENMADRLRDGTANRGERHGVAKLTDEKVREIRRRIALGDSQRMIAQDFGIQQQAVSNINVGKTWGWLG